MSEYVNDFDLTDFMDTSPSSPGFDQPTTSDYLDEIDWANPNYEDLANVDWSALHEDVMGVVLGEPADEQLQPGHWSGEEYLAQQTLLGPMAIDQSTAPCEYNHRTLSNSANGATFICGVSSCSAKAFKRRGDLKRHSLIHGTAKEFDCSAVGCKRRGVHGFTRKDKLKDHILDGHDDDTLFECPKCDMQLERDMWHIHHGWFSYFHLNEHRSCPMPRCSYKLHAPARHQARLDKMQQHLLEKHDAYGRTNFSNLLKQRGYDAPSCEVVCPVCPSLCQFPGHEEFYSHFLETHFHGPVCARHMDGSCTQSCFWRAAHWRLREWTSVPIDVRQHRRAILRIWPAFQYYPVWEDIKHCKPRA